jgi:uncharacterized membrane protein
MRTDPSDTGGLFIGRRPGTAPVRYRTPPERGGPGRRAFDGALAGAFLVAMTFVNICFWGPIPAGWLWVGSHVNYVTGSVSLGILSAFVGLLLTLLAALAVLKRLDQLWILVRRAAGHDQRTGVLGRVFAVTAALGAIGFTIWLLVFAGLGPMLAPKG